MQTQVQGEGQFSLGLEGKKVLIVDACTQIGAESARLLSSAGCFVALASSDREGLESQNADLKKNTTDPGKTATFHVDFQDDKSVEALVNNVILTFKELHIFVYASGPLKEDSVESFKVKDLDAHFHRNVRTPLLLTKLISPFLIKTKGCIVNVCSITGYRPVSIYCMVGQCQINTETEAALATGPTASRVTAMDGCEWFGLISISRSSRSTVVYTCGS